MSFTSCFRIDFGRMGRGVSLQVLRQEIRECARPGVGRSRGGVKRSGCAEQMRDVSAQTCSKARGEGRAVSRMWSWRLKLGSYTHPPLHLSMGGDAIFCFFFFKQKTAYEI